MKERCFKPDCPGYKDYGGRGITVCPQWLGKGGFRQFFKDMGKRPARGYSIERINNDGNYESGNCKWATRTEQNRNSRHNVNITHNGKTQCMSAWAEEFGISYSAFQTRVYRHGPKRAVEMGGKPLIRDSIKMIEYNGEVKTLSEWAAISGLARSGLAKRLDSGMSMAEAMNKPARSGKWQKSTDM